jgi:hypothetical protein
MTKRHSARFAATTLIDLAHSNIGDNPYVWTGRSATDTAIDFAGRYVDMGAGKIIDLAAGTDATDAVNKAQLDAATLGLSWKDAVDTATTGRLNDNTSMDTANDAAYSSGQITATLDASDTFIVDGITYSSADDGTRILVKSEGAAGTNASLGELANGIYTMTISGTSLTLDRATDMDAGDEFPGAAVFVVRGTVNDNAGYTCSNDVDPTMDVTAIQWSQFSGTGAHPTAIAASTGSTTQGILSVDSDLGLQLSDTGTKNALGIKLDTEGNGSGLSFDGTSKGLTVTVDATGGTTTINGSNELAVALKATPGLTASSGLGILLDSAPGLQLTSGLKILLDSNSGLQLTSGLKIVIPASSGLTLDGTGIYVDAHNGITVDGNGVSVTAYDGITVDGNGVSADLAALGGLEFSTTGGSGEIQINVDATAESVTTGTGATTGINASNEIMASKRIVEKVALDAQAITDKYQDGLSQVPVDTTAVTMYVIDSSGNASPMQEYGVEFKIVSDFTGTAVSSATETVSVAAGTGVYTVSTDPTTFVPGSIVEISGFTTAANNGQFLVTATTATTITTTNTASVLESDGTDWAIKAANLNRITWDDSNYQTSSAPTTGMDGDLLATDSLVLEYEYLDLT